VDSLNLAIEQLSLSAQLERGDEMRMFRRAKKFHPREVAINRRPQLSELSMYMPLFFNIFFLG
jgi:hypothetical protein